MLMSVRRDIMTYEVYPTRTEARERAMVLHKERGLVMITPTGEGDYVVISPRDGGR